MVDHALHVSLCGMCRQNLGRESDEAFTLGQNTSVDVGDVM
jgi:hypothetical protein